MTTPIAQLDLAIKGAWDFALDTTPWVKRAPPAPPPQTRADVVRNWKTWVSGHNAAVRARKRRRR